MSSSVFQETALYLWSLGGISVCLGFFVFFHGLWVGFLDVFFFGFGGFFLLFVCLVFVPGVWGSFSLDFWGLFWFFGLFLFCVWFSYFFFGFGFVWALHWSEAQSVGFQGFLTLLFRRSCLPSRSLFSRTICPLLSKAVETLFSDNFGFHQMRKWMIQGPRFYRSSFLFSHFQPFPTHLLFLLVHFLFWEIVIFCCLPLILMSHHLLSSLVDASSMEAFKGRLDGSQPCLVQGVPAMDKVIFRVPNPSAVLWFWFQWSFKALWRGSCSPLGLQTQPLSISQDSLVVCWAAKLSGIVHLMLKWSQPFAFRM